MNHRLSGALIAVVAMLGALGASDCVDRRQPQSASGASIASVEIPLNTDGRTAEQQNIRDRLLEDNKPGSIKHIYVISAYSGQVIMYSTVRGKVTSSGKRLTPISVDTDSNWGGFPLRIGTWEGRTGEVLQDDGAYGSSSEYLYWWDTRGIYHQHYVSGGQIVHVSNQPIVVKGIIINLASEGNKATSGAE